MKRYLAVVLAAGLIVLNAGCETNKTQVAEGAGIGGALGAIAGGIIGNQTGSPVTGALIGGAVGATAGGIIGAQINKPSQQATHQPAAEQITMQQVVDMTKRKVSDDFIIDKIKASNTTFVLSASDLDYLRNKGVSQRVIEAMQGK